ncbi:helix-turn-helix domain-containing protein [Novosphingobium sp. JCM 18896]|uniref:helix-turn-helix domain-containing protein n=1 Tax=Novosphingobium sp. JCM 18896 TaxID=2989731 RepID=UPI002222D5DC|nr:short-chain fatty acyl-CoA regulator family protein [Novosphingobium sp. JCM 18896]MCW1427624.1 short-chain fatty acyl-CoA regulator family protein [Novosphingobium sp. JCM 18896]
MVDNRSLYLGPRIKRLRRELGLTQQAMAEDLAISPSYVALLERNQRPLTAPLLLRLARTYKLDMEDLAAEEGEDYARRVAEVLRDPIFSDIDLPALEVADLATNFPGVSEALLRLHGAYLREQQALAEQRVPGAEEGADPVAEARRFVARERNHFPDLDARAEALAAEIAEAGGAQEFLRKRGLRVRFLPPEVLVDTIRRYDRHNEQLLIDETLDAAGRAWQLAIHIAYTVMRSDIARIVRAETFASQTAATLVRRALAGYAAAALVMPYDKFARAAESRRYDIEALASLFGTSFEQTAHRLTTLGRPGREGVPFFFIRVDQAGNVSKRLDGAGFPFAAHGGSCPLWSVHSVFGRPGEVVTQWLELPDGQRFFSIARRVTSGGGRWGRSQVHGAIALACAAEHAPKLVYAEGHDPRSVPATPIGVTCRLCHRASCPARAAPPIGREILPDDYRRAAEPFTLGES